MPMNNGIANAGSKPGTAERPLKMPGLMALLVSRVALFLLFQGIIALSAGSWSRSEGSWLVVATVTNFVSITVLWFLFRREGVSYWSLFRFNRSTFRKDILVFAGLFLLCGPVVFGPNYLLSTWLWGDPAIPYEMMFRPGERWLSILLLIAFPVTIVFAELATYFGYIMPRLKERLETKWIAVALPVVFLSLQHIALPFIPDLKFILYRAVVFLPFAALIGIALHRRPSLFPWFAILHGIMDMGTAAMMLTE